MSRGLGRRQREILATLAKLPPGQWWPVAALAVDDPEADPNLMTDGTVEVILILSRDQPARSRLVSTRRAVDTLAARGLVEVVHSSVSVGGTRAVVRLPAA